MEQGLIDEYALTVCPAQRGKASPSLGRAGQLHCWTWRNAAQKTGMVLLRYVPRRTDGMEPAPQGAQ